METVRITASQHATVDLLPSTSCLRITACSPPNGKQAAANASFPLILPGMRIINASRIRIIELGTAYLAIELQCEIDQGSLQSEDRFKCAEYVYRQFAWTY